MNTYIKYFLKLTSMFFACTFNNIATADVVSNFDDGTLQGWAKGTPFFNTAFSGELEISVDGNPNWSLVATDAIGAGGQLLAKAPEKFTGDLSIYSSVSWDEYLPENSVGRTSITLVGANNTVYTGTTSDQHVINSKKWKRRSIPLSYLSATWELREGSDTFQDVLSHVKELYIQMDVTQINFGNLPEASIDNVTLVEDPCINGQCASELEQIKDLKCIIYPQGVHIDWPDVENTEGYQVEILNTDIHDIIPIAKGYSYYNRSSIPSRAFSYRVRPTIGGKGPWSTRKFGSNCYIFGTIISNPIYNP